MRLVGSSFALGGAPGRPLRAGPRAVLDARETGGATARRGTSP